MRRPSILLFTMAMSFSFAACSSGSGSNTGQPDIGNTIVPDPTTPAPGSCDPLDTQIPPPSITIGGNTTDATFGVGAYQCSTIAGNGYIINNFNPVLIDASKAGTVTVKVNSDAVAKLVLDSGGAFDQTGDQEWTSAQPVTGCDRLTITLKSPTGLSRATYGADIRIGGETVACPQRDIDPTDVGAVETVPPGSFPEVPVESVTSAPDTTDSTADSPTDSISDSTVDVTASTGG